MSATPEDAGQKSKLFIDEDWKSQVQAEKEALERKKQGSAAASTAQTADAGPVHAAQSRGPLPPATLAVLCTTLATQALAAPDAEKVEVNLEDAQHFIDLLEMLETKTAGNRSPEESHLLDNLLHELRLVFVDVRSHAVSAARE